jgi:formylglycine-generating enzyme required for sulfatase activity
VQRGKTLKLAINLEEITGLLNIRTTPAGAGIQINGDPVGQSPLSLKKGGGSYQIEVVHGDFQSITENVEITNAETVIERDYRLALKDATLHVTVSPVGGKLLLNGKAVQPGSLALKAGVDHSLIYLKAGHFSQRQTISLAADAEQDASFNLKAEFGKVGFYSTPNATVKLDGRDVGKTPLVLTLPALSHRLELHKKGYRSFKQAVTPSSKSAQQIRVRLLTKQQARLAEAPKRYKNTAGIELKQFRPGGVFVMGAPRHEKGQRANEFLRTVKLTMPFYIATHEVSRIQYRRFRKVQGAGNEPVTSISWIDAAQYCNWLSRQEKLTPFYDIRAGQLQVSNIRSDGYRLPSEAEWEWLARKAGKSEQTRFTWGDATTIPENSGNIADEFAKGKTSHYVPNYSDGYAGVAPVGSYPPESTGLHDLTGNVSEWVHDVYTLVPPDAQTVASDPLGDSQGGTHTVKGSNWRSGRITELRASYREGEKEGRDDIGFRVARYVYGGSNGQY